MTTQKMYDDGLRCRSKGFCRLCKDSKGCVEYVTDTIEEFSKLKPIGVKPKWLWVQGRINDLKGAIERYTEANEEIPSEWIEEYNELLAEYKKLMKNSKANKITEDKEEFKINDRVKVKLTGEKGKIIVIDTITDFRNTKYFVEFNEKRYGVYNEIHGNKTDSYFAVEIEKIKEGEI